MWQKLKKNVCFTTKVSNNNNRFVFIYIVCSTIVSSRNTLQHKIQNTTKKNKFVTKETNHFLLAVDVEDEQIHHYASSICYNDVMLSC